MTPCLLLPQTPDPTNPLYRPAGLPAFDRILPEHVVPAMERMLEEAETGFSALEASVQPTWRSAVEALDDLMRPLGAAWGIVHHLQGVQASDPLREAIEAVQPRFVTLSLRVGQSRAFYDALTALRASEGLSEAQVRVLDERIRSARHAGVALDGSARDRFNEISQELAQAGLHFAHHVLDATKAVSWEWTDPTDMDGAPETLRAQLAQAYKRAHPEAEATAAQGPWRMTLERALVAPFLEHVPDRAKREAVYRAYGHIATEGAHDNGPLVQRILCLRDEKAKLLGYPTYAALSTASKMAEVPAIYDLLHQLREAARPAARRELTALEERAARADAPLPLMPWDVAFWRERVKEERFQIRDEELRAYLQEPKVLEGLFAVVQDVFGVEVVAADGQVPVWDPSVRFFHVRDARSSELVAAFYLDPYSRPENKRAGAWMDTCLGRRRLEGGDTQVPVAYLVCNATPPTPGRPALLSFDEVTTLFHEFGHGLHHMLTRVDVEPVAGIDGVEWDAVELPSQFMENWCYDIPTLRGMTSHVETGEPMPHDLIERLRAARTFCEGLATLRQLVLGLTDLRLHDGFVPASPDDAFRLQEGIERETSVLPFVEGYRQLCSFQHIFAGGYAAGYYSYKWAEVLSADAFEAFEEVGLDNREALREVGRRFRDTVLALGGSRHPSAIYRDFRGRDARPDALFRQSGFTETIDA